MKSFDDVVSKLEELKTEISASREINVKALEVLERFAKSSEETVDAIDDQRKAFLSERDKAALEAAEKDKELFKRGDNEGMASGAWGGVVAAATGVGGLTAGLLAMASAFTMLRDDVEDTTMQIVERMNGFIVSLNSPLFFSRIFDSIRLVITAPLRIMKSLSDMIQRGFGASRIFARIGAIMTRIIRVIEGPFRVLARMTRGVGSLGRIVGRMLGPIGSIARVFGRLSGVFTIAYGLFEGIRRAWEPLMQGNYMDALFAFVEGFTDSFISLIGDLGGFFGWISEKIVMFLGGSEEQAAAVRSGIEGAFNQVENIVTWIRDLFLNIARPIADWVAGAAQRLTEMDLFGAAQRAFDGAQEFMSGLGDSIANKVQEARSLVENAYNAVSGFFGRIGEELNNFIDWVTFWDNGDPAAAPTSASSRSREAEGIASSIYRETLFTHGSPSYWAGRDRAGNERLMQEVAMREMQPRRTARDGAEVTSRGRDLAAATRSHTTAVLNAPTNVTSVNQSSSTQMIGGSRVPPANAVQRPGRYITF